MPNFKKNTSPAMKRSGFKMKGYAYPGTSPIQQVAYDKDGEPIHKKKTRTKVIAPKKLYGGNIPITPPISSQSKKPKGTLKGLTGFEADFPIVSKVHKLINPVATTKRKIKLVKDIGKGIVKKGKKAYEYFTKK
tara:strand:+ start:44 stop:445 length:402 start_codon:yes stop_codon:yes gene_type:complete